MESALRSAAEAAAAGVSAQPPQGASLQVLPMKAHPDGRACSVATHAYTLAQQTTHDAQRATLVAAFTWPALPAADEAVLVTAVQDALEFCARNGVTLLAMSTVERGTVGSAVWDAVKEAASHALVTVLACETWTDESGTHTRVDSYAPHQRGVVAYMPNNTVVSTGSSAVQLPHKVGTVLVNACTKNVAYPAGEDAPSFNMVVDFGGSGARGAGTTAYAIANSINHKTTTLSVPLAASGPALVVAPDGTRTPSLAQQQASQGGVVVVEVTVERHLEANMVSPMRQDVGSPLMLASSPPASYMPPMMMLSESGAAASAADAAAAAAAAGSGAVEEARKDPLSEYVRNLGGTTVIRRVLIANNGVAAVKMMRSCRAWAYDTFGDMQVVHFVAMATPEDMQANAEYIRMADEVVTVPGGSNANNFANVEIITDLALRKGVQAVWAGWGHASENPRLPAMLKANGIVFIGPPSTAMRDLGDKICSTIIAESVNVKTMPWSGSGLRVRYQDEGVPPAIFDRACVHTADEAEARAADIGFPIMVKASEGGGGKGIRKVHNNEELRVGFRQVQGEVPGSPIFLMKLAHSARHLEVQVLADEYGNAMSLYGRDCSVQRRHQKIIEEGPVVAAPPDVWAQMEAAAVRLTKEVKYVGAGTVEYLYISADEYYFLELNPRLQVEHPVTEWVTDVNLPAAQLQVAMGVPLHRIPDIRRLYGRNAFGTSPIDFESDKRLPPKGHVISVRITAENPDAGFKPTSGLIQELTFQSIKDVWGYFSVGAQGGVHEFSDSQFGHLFSWGESREHSRKKMVVALKRLSIRGDIRTTVEYLIELLEKDEFRRNNINTVWLDGLIAQIEASAAGKASGAMVPGSQPSPADMRELFVSVMCGALFRAYSVYRRNVRVFLEYLERGQVPSSEYMRTAHSVELIHNAVKYPMEVVQSGPTTMYVVLNGQIVVADVRGLPDESLLISLGGKSYTVYGSEEITGLRLSVNKQTVIFPKQEDPTQLRTTMAGRLARYLVSDGDHVDAGTMYAEIEVMKMYLPLVTSESGTIRLLMSETSPLRPGDMLARLELDPGSQRTKPAEPFEGELPASLVSGSVDGTTVEPRGEGDAKAFHVLRDALSTLRNMLRGYISDGAPSQARMKHALATLRRAALNQRVPFQEFEEALSKVEARLDKALVGQMKAALSKARGELEADEDASSVSSFAASAQGGETGAVTSTADGSATFFPAAALLAQIEAASATVPSETRSAFDACVDPLRVLLGRFADGLAGHINALVGELCGEYLTVERLFEGTANVDDVCLQLRESHTAEEVYDIMLSHSRLPLKNRVVKHLCDMVGDARTHKALQELAALQGAAYAPLVMHIKQLEMFHNLPSFTHRRHLIEHFLSETVGSLPEGDMVAWTAARDKLEHLAHSSGYLIDTLVDLFSSDNAAVRQAAAEVYVRRVYGMYEITSVSASDWNHFPLVKWTFHSGTDRDVAASPVASKKAGGIPSSSSSFPRVDSMGDVSALDPSRFGMMAMFPSSAALFSGLVPLLRQEYTPAETHAAESAPLYNVLNVVLPGDDKEDVMVGEVASFVRESAVLLRQLGVRRVTLLISRRAQFPSYYTFRESLDFAEDTVARDIEPPLAHMLLLEKLANFDITYYPTLVRQVHVYVGEERTDGPAPARLADRRIFVRAFARRGDVLEDNDSTIGMQQTEGERVVVEALNSLELAINDPTVAPSMCNHIFLHIIPDVTSDLREMRALMMSVMDKYSARMRSLNVVGVEVKVSMRKRAGPHRLALWYVLRNQTSWVSDVGGYMEVDQGGETPVFQSLDRVDAVQLDGKGVEEPYPLLTGAERARIMAQRRHTAYCYDFPLLFERAIAETWADAGEAVPAECLRAVELVVNAAGDALEEVQRPAGENVHGMVAWRWHVRTRECPAGRDVIVIANDITKFNGSFGPDEDTLFFLASQLARHEGLPRVYLAANAGARIGLAREVKECFRVEWVDASNPTKGVAFLYLTPSDYEALGGAVSESVVCAPCTLADGTAAFRLVDVVGKEHGLGVENLSGSGKIASETSQAYDETFTLTYVTGQSVGIGAYLVRLGQRVIQKVSQPIILTGFTALNRVLGRSVYSSHMQLGGPQIMYNNGVSHEVVDDDWEGVHSILRWLAFVPAVQNAPLPVLTGSALSDPVDRDVTFEPPKAGVYDVRHLITGCVAEDGKTWCSGLFDRGSFRESLAGWARTVVTGRARLGGVPVGVIGVETRTISVVIPADPALVESTEQQLQKPGQVWFPDTAKKTAQAIRDFDRGEQLPLIILANWRGFSGGMRDMFDEILKFGSNIVDNLREYRQPVFVYIPPWAELRGGAWVVLDSTINGDMMEMYADMRARGGVLEPIGTIAIKFKQRDMVKCMHRLDDKLAALKAADGGAVDADAVAAREKELLPVYKSVAERFAELHDTPGRMKAKGCIRDVVPWSNARRYLFWRLSRRLAVLDVLRRVREYNAGATLSSVQEQLRAWVDADGGAGLWEDDPAMVAWLRAHEADVEARVRTMCVGAVEARMAALHREHGDVLREGVAAWLATLSPEERAKMLQ